MRFEQTWQGGRFDPAGQESYPRFPVCLLYTSMKPNKTRRVSSNRTHGGFSQPMSCVTYFLP